MKSNSSSFLKIIRQLLINKYTFVLLVFFLYLTFFDDHNLIKKHKISQEIKQLEQEYRYYLDEIETNKGWIDNLNRDTVFLEKYAREKYYMKRANEDVFIFK